MSADLFKRNSDKCFFPMNFAKSLRKRFHKTPLGEYFRWNNDVIEMNTLEILKIILEWNIN